MSRKIKVCLIYGGQTIESEYSHKSFKYLRNILKNDFIVDGVDFTNLLFDGDKVSVLKQSDVAISLVYGCPGQEGMVQNICEAMNVKYIGSDSFACSLIKDKVYAKEVCSANGIMVPKTYKNIDVETFSEFPVVVKPRRKGGLSLGITYCNTKNELKKAIEEAKKYDELVFVEEYIKGTEVTSCVTRNGKEHEVLPLIYTEKDVPICNYEAKVEGKRKMVINPELTEGITEKVKDITLKIFNVFKMKDYGYFDFMIKDSEVYFIEAGAVPGLTENSNIPQIFKYLKRDICELIRECINNEVNRNE